MAITIASAPEQRTTSSSQAIATLIVAWLRRSVGLSDAFQPKPGEAQAIAILRDVSSALDRREWAERYLCGMTKADVATHGINGRAQS